MKSTTIVQAPQKIAARVCPACGKSSVDREWQQLTKRELIEEAGKRAAKLAKGAKLEVGAEKFKIAALEQSRTVPILMRATLEVDGKKVFDEIRTVLQLKPFVCPDCSKKSSHYYEATMQLRGSPQEVKWLQKHISQRIDELSKTHRLSFISGMTIVHGGVDLRVGSKEVAEKIAEGLRRLKKVETKRSFSIAGMREGKQYHRETILVRAGETAE